MKHEASTQKHTQALTSSFVVSIRRTKRAISSLDAVVGRGNWGGVAPEPSDGAFRTEPRLPRGDLGDLGDARIVCVDGARERGGELRVEEVTEVFFLIDRGSITTPVICGETGCSALGVVSKFSVGSNGCRLLRGIRGVRGVRGVTRGPGDCPGDSEEFTSVASCAKSASNEGMGSST